MGLGLGFGVFDYFTPHDDLLFCTRYSFSNIVLICSFLPLLLGVSKSEKERERRETKVG